MKIAVLGTGVVGRSLAGKLDALGHTVALGTRNPDETAARDTGENSFSAWRDRHPDIVIGTFAAAAAAGEVVVNALSGAAALGVLREAHGALEGKVLLDISNPLDSSRGLPPVFAGDVKRSLAEQIQAALVDVKVVKTLNTMSAALMVDPGSLAGGDHTVFLSGDDHVAKALVTALLGELGHTDIIDLGGLETARGAEMVLPLWLYLMQALGTARFQFKVVR